MHSKPGPQIQTSFPKIIPQHYPERMRHQNKFHALKQRVQKPRGAELTATISLAGSISAKSDALQGNTERCSFLNHPSDFQGTFRARRTRQSSQSDWEPLGISFHPASNRSNTCSYAQRKPPLMVAAFAEMRKGSGILKLLICQWAWVSTER